MNEFISKNNDNYLHVYSVFDKDEDLVFEVVNEYAGNDDCMGLEVKVSLNRSEIEDLVSTLQNWLTEHKCEENKE